MVQCFLTFSHPEVKHGLTNEGIPQVNLDQLNPRRMFPDFTIPFIPITTKLRTFEDDEVWNFVSVAMKLTRGKLRKTEEWDEWHNSEYQQLD